MTYSINCPIIQLKKFRTSRLRELLDNVLTFKGVDLEDIYSSVLSHFGNEICQPDKMCPHSNMKQPEFKHVVRLALWDGRNKRKYKNLRYKVWGLHESKLEIIDTQNEESIQGRKDEIRLLQAKFETSRQEYLKDYADLERLRKRFVRKFPIKDILDMSLEEYVVGHGDKDSFCYWLETALMPLGKIKGGTTADKKFGVYYSSGKKEYVTIMKFGDTLEETFSNIKQEIYDLLIVGEEKDIEAIKDNTISPMFKGKILSTYYPEDYLNIFSEYHLDYFLDILRIHYDLTHDIIDKRMLLLDFKNGDEIMKNWNYFIFMKFLYDSFGYPPKSDDAPKELKEYLESKDDYPNLKQVIPENIDLIIIPENIKISGKTRNFKGKIDFDRENKIKRNLGKRGEEIVLKFEEEFLKKKDREDLAEKIEWVSQKDDSLGYDIISFDEEGKKKFIEVKATTRSPSYVNFIISSNQYKVAQEKENYYFYIVFNAKSTNPKVWKLKNPIKQLDKGLSLIPINYRVIINTKKE